MSGQPQPPQPSTTGTNTSSANTTGANPSSSTSITGTSSSNTSTSTTGTSSSSTSLSTTGTATSGTTTSISNTVPNWRVKLIDQTIHELESQLLKVISDVNSMSLTITESELANKPNVELKGRAARITAYAEMLQERLENQLKSKEDLLAGKNVRFALPKYQVTSQPPVVPTITPPDPDSAFLSRVPMDGGSPDVAFMSPRPTQRSQLTSARSTYAVTEEKEKPLSVPHGLPLFRNAGANGIPNPYAFLRRFERICEAHSYPVGRMKKLLYICLDETDSDWLDSLLSAQPQLEWKDVYDEFLKHFRDPKESYKLRHLLRETVMGNDSVQRYADRFQAICARLNLSDEDEEALYWFEEGLAPHIKSKFVSATLFHRTTRLSEMREAAIDLEVRMNRPRRNDTAKTPSKVDKTPAKTTPERTAKTKVDRCEYCNRLGHRTSECLKKQKDESEGVHRAKVPQDEKPVCYHCKQPGHRKNQCPQLTKEEPKESKREVRAISTAGSTPHSK